MNPLIFRNSRNTEFLITKCWQIDSECLRGYTLRYALESSTSHSFSRVSRRSGIRISNIQSSKRTSSLFPSLLESPWIEIPIDSNSPSVNTRQPPSASISSIMQRMHEKLRRHLYSLAASQSSLIPFYSPSERTDDHSDRKSGWSVSREIYVYHTSQKKKKWKWLLKEKIQEKK